MFALAADYLMGWAMASADGARKQHAEWPPHPDRVFMALAAAWFETGCNVEEGAALRWLESLPPPQLAASGHAARTSVANFVPVNDTSNPFENEAKGVCAPYIQGVLLHRRRRERFFPVAIPNEPLVYFIWSADLPDEYRVSLDALCRKVSAIGHSASLVRMWVSDTAPTPTWVPEEGPTAIRLRITSSGRLSYLELRMNKQEVLAHAAMIGALDRAKTKADKLRAKEALEARFPDGIRPVSLRPEPGLWQSYVQPGGVRAVDEVLRGIFDERMIVLTLAGQRLALETTLPLTTALRGALLSSCNAPVPEWLSGHADSGAPTREPHLALLPLAFTGATHADGRLMGIALAVPRSVSPAEAARVLGPFLYGGDGLPRSTRLFAGATLECTASLETHERPAAALNVSTWIGPSRRWATVTPIALDRHFDRNGLWDLAADVVAEACVRIGLPRPVDVLLHSNSLLEGVPPARRFPPIVRKKDGGRLVHAHAVLTFDRDVMGPVVVGAGRFRGYGLCRPLRASGGGE